MAVNRKVEEPVNFNSAWNNIETIFIKSEIEDEAIDDNSSIPPECIDSTVNDFSEGNSEVVCKDTKIGLNHIPTNSESARADVEEDFENCEKSKNTSVNHKKPIKSSKPKFSQQNDVSDMCSSRIGSRKRAVAKPYRCEVCDKCFNRPSNLGRHKLTHTGVKPYRCDICNKHFISDIKLIYHKRIHTGEKPYQCDVCKKSFTQSSNMKYHKLTHTGEKTYQCEVCKKYFTQSGSLKLHKRIHTGEKPYRCDKCDKCFTQSYSLKLHKLLHASEQPHRCDICNDDFTSLRKLVHHKRVHTDEKPNH